MRFSLPSHFAVPNQALNHVCSGCADKEGFLKAEQTEIMCSVYWENQLLIAIIIVTSFHLSIPKSGRADLNNASCSSMSYLHAKERGYRMCDSNWRGQETIVEPLQGSPLFLYWSAEVLLDKDLCSKQRKVMGFECFFFQKAKVATFYKCHRREVPMTVNIKLGQREREGKNKTM